MTDEGDAKRKPGTTGEVTMQEVANDVLFVAQHQQNLRDGFVPVGGISASADADEQREFDKAFARKVREMEEATDKAEA